MVLLLFLVDWQNISFIYVLHAGNEQLYSLVPAIQKLPSFIKRIYPHSWLDTLWLGFRRIVLILVVAGQLNQDA
jgi:hypothetical protein